MTELCEDCEVDKESWEEFEDDGGVRGEEEELEDEDEIEEDGGEGAEVEVRGEGVTAVMVEGRATMALRLVEEETTEEEGKEGVELEEGGGVALRAMGEYRFVGTL